MLFRCAPRPCVMMKESLWTTYNPFVADEPLSIGSYPLTHPCATHSRLKLEVEKPASMLTCDPSKPQHVGHRPDLGFVVPVQCLFLRADIRIPYRQVGFLPRLFYYILLIISLILRENYCLSTAAHGAAITHAAIASIHAFCIAAEMKTVCRHGTIVTGYICQHMSLEILTRTVFSPFWLPEVQC